MATVVEETVSMRVRWALWVVCVAVWTLLLLTPDPVRVAPAVLPEKAIYPVAKTLHITAYAILTGLVYWLHLAGRRHWLLVAFLLCHGMATEALQTLVPLRHGSVADVGFDFLGIGIGLALSWPWWRGR